MNKIPAYLPQDPNILIDAVSNACNLPAGAEVIGLVVVIEDTETIHTAALANKSSREYVLDSVNHALEAIGNGEPPTAIFKKGGQDVRH